MLKLETKKEKSMTMSSEESLRKSGVKVKEDRNYIDDEIPNINNNSNALWNHTW